MYSIGNCRIITGRRVETGLKLVLDGDKIADIVTDDGNYDYDARGGYAAAGFVDMHTHGGFGCDFMDATDEAIEGVTKFHLTNGTTSLLATTVTASVSDTLRTIAAVRSYMGREKYARIAGMHLEGPFLSVKNRGAQLEAYLLDPGKDDYTFILDNADIIKTVTISPERDKDGTMTARLTAAGITVCGGHDDGLYPEYVPSVKNGLKHLTHFWCAMSGIDFRDDVRRVGLREYGLLDDDLTVELIADNHHTPAELAKMIIKVKGVDSVCVVSDSLRAAGCEDENRIFYLGNADDATAQKFVVKDGVAVVYGSKKYAGSVQPVGRMVKNLIEMGVPIPDAFMMGTENPARFASLDGVGSLKPGNYADVNVFDDKLKLKQVFIGGKKADVK